MKSPNQEYINNMILHKWMEKHSLLFINRSYGRYTTNIVSEESLLDLIASLQPPSSDHQPLHILNPTMT